MNMIYSKNGLHLTESSEGVELKAYHGACDPAELWTIGYGHTKDVKEGDICTQEGAELFLIGDLQNCARFVNKHAKVELSQGEFDAVVDFSFNLGLGSLEHSTLWAMLNAGDFAAAAAQFPKWDMAGGKEVEGLLRRRQAEQVLFQSKA